MPADPFFHALWIGAHGNTYGRQSMRILAVMAIALMAACGGADTAPAPEGIGLTEQERQDSGQLLFDGTSVEGWTPRGEASWIVEDGAITAEVGSGRGFLVTNGSYENFTLHLEFWVDDVANGGVFIRVPEVGDISQSNSFEVNIFDAHEFWPTGSINEIQRYDAQPSAGRWNTFEITADGDHLVVLMNGQPAVDARAERLPEGPIAIQYAGQGEIRYRNITIREL